MTNYKICHIAGEITGVNREPLSGEDVFSFPADKCGWVIRDPWMYKAVNNTVVKRSKTEIAKLEVPRLIAKKQAEVRIKCREYIYASYPAEVQSSMSLGIYPYDDNALMTNFIAACIAEENKTYDALALATTKAEVDSINPIFPVAK